MVTSQVALSYFASILFSRSAEFKSSPMLMLRVFLICCTLQANKSSMNDPILNSWSKLKDLWDLPLNCLRWSANCAFTFLFLNLSRADFISSSGTNLAYTSMFTLAFSLILITYIPNSSEFL
eukprot:NODE_354_length_10253_cov_0.271519.p8 type:complete len:122 gc:universal NODE_354_length_10253_cov_0.271519:9442-9077(-)